MKEILLNVTFSILSSCPGSSRDIGMYMTRIILRHREVGRVVTTMARMLHNSVTVGIQSNLDKWRKSVGGDGGHKLHLEAVGLGHQDIQQRDTRLIQEK